MKAALVRIGTDSSYGNWNAPADPCSMEFVYIPIPETGRFKIGMETYYQNSIKDLAIFPQACNEGLEKGSIIIPAHLYGAKTHLDPDFEYLTYGDDGAKRGKQISMFKSGDLLVFYAGLRSIHTSYLVYAMIGIYIIDQIVKATNVRKQEHHTNAHTRKTSIHHSDIVIFANPARSGRLDKYIPIGEYRNGAYRVTKDILNQWGGLSVKDGYIQRSAVPPLFNEPEKFYTWFEQKNIGLVQKNNP